MANQGSPPSPGAFSGGNHIVNAPLRSTMINLALPVVAEQFLNTLVGLVDTYLAGQLPHGSVAATSAVGLASYVGWLVSMLFALVAMGTTALVARACGSGDRPLANGVTNQSMMLAIVMGLIGAPAMYALAPYFAGFLGMSGETLAIAVRYLQIDAFGYVLWALTLVGSAALRGAGDMRTPLVVLGVVNAFNVVLSPSLVYGLGPIPVFGVNGIVYGTLCARTVGGVLIVLVLLRNRRGLKLRFRAFRPDRAIIARLLRIGTPAAADGVIMWVGHLCFLWIVGQLTRTTDPTALAAQILVVRLEAFTYLPASAWAAACATMIGQALGAGNTPRARSSGHEGALQCGSVTALVGAAFILFSGPICRLMHNDPAVIATASRLLIIAGALQPILALHIVYTGALKGAGDTVRPMIISAVGLALFRVPLGYWFGLHLGYGLLGAWVGVGVDLVVRMSLVVGCFVRGKWALVRV